MAKEIQAAQEVNQKKILLIDMALVTLMMFIPAISHLTGIPVYMVEPMRIMLVISLLLTPNRNAYFIAILLPLVSFLVSGHPFPAKMMIIIAELLFNVWLFLAMKRAAGTFFSMLLAIIISKLACYMMYWSFFSWAFVVEESGARFLLAQAAVTIFLSFFALALSGEFRFKSRKNI
jgi:hypothetical protein